jgi:mycothiol synthase
VITVRTVDTEADVDTYVDVRRRVHPQTPIPREAVVDQRRRPDNLDLIAELGGVPVGAATVAKFGGAPDGDVAYLTIRVVADARRQGVGTALHRRASDHARSLGKSGHLVVVRADDPDSLGYYDARDFVERARMQDVSLELATAETEFAVPDGIELRPATEEHDRGIYEVALEADADVPSAEPLVTGAFEQWRDRLFGSLAVRDLSFVALERGRVVGYAVIGRHTEDTAQHWMTGVARAARGRGIALALKQAQIAAAKDAGWAFLQTQNDLGNAPMRRVNEKLGYERRFEWVHLVGPLLP